MSPTLQQSSWNSAFPCNCHWHRGRLCNGGPRLIECDIMQDRVEKTVRLWKSGKFMQLSMRSWSMNSYCLPKVWFRAHCVDLRKVDVSKIHGNVKNWIYGDQFLKPEERIHFLPSSYGGLGVQVGMKPQHCCCSETRHRS